MAGTCIFVEHQWSKFAAREFYIYLKMNFFVADNCEKMNKNAFCFEFCLKYFFKFCTAYFYYLMWGQSYNKIDVAKHNFIMIYINFDVI